MRCQLRCISPLSYIKPQLAAAVAATVGSCISPLSYIKPQPSPSFVYFPTVVFLLYPTSNRNQVAHESCGLLLYFSFILHQTATATTIFILAMSCISPLSYIKPQPKKSTSLKKNCCISPLSYIKPQPCITPGNGASGCISPLSYIKPQLCTGLTGLLCGCISPLSYIKPQPKFQKTLDINNLHLLTN